MTPALIKILYDLNNAIVLVARLPQIHQNYKVRKRMHITLMRCNVPACMLSTTSGSSVLEATVGLHGVQSKSTGQLSGTMYAANFLGCIARIFTSVQEGGGYAMVRGYLLGAISAMRNSVQWVASAGHSKPAMALILYFDALLNGFMMIPGLLLNGTIFLQTVVYSKRPEKKVA